MRPISNTSWITVNFKAHPHMCTSVFHLDIGDRARQYTSNPTIFISVCWKYIMRLLRLCQFYVLIPQNSPP